MDFVIEKSKWLRGVNGRLLLEGKMCCLGFASLQLGCSEREIYGKSTPGQVNNTVIRPVLTRVEDGYNNDLSVDAMRINDDPDITDEFRMKQLTELFESYGHKITFVE